MSSLQFSSSIVTVSAWTDPVVDHLGHDPRSLYVETFWLPIVGPSTVWLVRRLVRGLQCRPDGYDLDLDATAEALGLGARRGMHGPFMRTLTRAAQFGLVRQLDATGLAARRRLPPLTRNQLARLPEHLRAEHDQHRDRARQLPPADRTEAARRLALSLAELGEDTAAIEDHLTGWRFHPSVAAESATWAHTVAAHTTPDP